MNKLIKYVKKYILDTNVYTAFVLYVVLIIALIYNCSVKNCEKGLVKGVSVLSFWFFLALFIYVLIKVVIFKIKKE